MTSQSSITDATSRTLVLVTGPSGAGRSTAINALEDAGFETIDNMPLSLLPRLLEGHPSDQSLALGIDVRNRDFSEAAFIHLIDGLTGEANLVFLDARDEVLERRYSETRRRHPLNPDGAPIEGIAVERGLLVQIRSRSDLLIDTSEMTPHDLKAEMSRYFAPGGVAKMAVTVESFSFKRGVPLNADMVLDCRFLNNPHWDAALRPLDGRSTEVTNYVQSDPNFELFRKKVVDLVEFLLPSYQSEGKSHFTIAFGCTGGKHRSVSLTETLARALADQGWQVNKRHRELERTATVSQGQQQGIPL